MFDVRVCISVTIIIIIIIIIIIFSPCKNEGEKKIQK